MPNLWATFKKLTYVVSLRVGQVQSHEGTMSKLLDDYGQTFLATGTSVGVGSRAFVENGIVTEEAPNLPQYSEYV